MEKTLQSCGEKRRKMWKKLHTRENLLSGEKRRKMWKKLYKDVEKNRGVEKIGNADGYDHIFVERITQRSGEN